MRLWTAGVCSTSISASLIVIASDAILRTVYKDKQKRDVPEAVRKTKKELSGRCDWEVLACAQCAGQNFATLDWTLVAFACAGFVTYAGGLIMRQDQSQRPELPQLPPQNLDCI